MHKKDSLKVFKRDPIVERPARYSISSTETVLQRITRTPADSYTPGNEKREKSVEKSPKIYWVTQHTRTVLSVRTM